MNERKGVFNALLDYNILWEGKKWRINTFRHTLSGCESTVASGLGLRCQRR